MKKLRMKLDELRVDTFATGGHLAARGTVQGHYGTTHTQAGETCDYTCGDTCQNTCTQTNLYTDCNGMQCAA